MKEVALIVAKDGDKVVGFVGYGENRDDSLVDCGEVFAIYVLAIITAGALGMSL